MSAGFGRAHKAWREYIAALPHVFVVTESCDGETLPVAVYATKELAQAFSGRQPKKVAGYRVRHEITRWPLFDDATEAEADRLRDVALDLTNRGTK